MAYEYNPLLPMNLQKKADTASIEEEIDVLKSSKITKCKTASDFSLLEADEIFEWQGDTTSTLQNGFFYKVSSPSVVIEPNAKYYRVISDITVNGITIKANDYYIVEDLTSDYIGGRYYTRLPQDGYYYAFTKSSNAYRPAIGDYLFDNVNNIFVSVVSISGHNYTLSDGNTVDFSSRAFQDPTTVFKCVALDGSFIIVAPKVENNTNKLSILCVYNNEFVPIVLEPYTEWNLLTTSSEIVIPPQFVNVDTQERIQGVTNAPDGSLVISRDVEFSGNITVKGTQTIVETQEIDSTNDFINLRVDNPLALADGEMSGISVKNYDGNNNNLDLVVDKNGWARVGDENGTLQKLATIEENPTNGEFVKYNTTTKQLESGTIPTPAEATTTTAGLMSAADKDKLNGIATGAQVNPTATAVSSYSGANGVSIKAVKYGRIVSLFVTSATTNTVSITLASQFKPLNQFLTGLYWNSNNSITVNVGTDGVAKVSGLWNTSQGNFMCTYFSAS